ncbi:MAG TPA: GSU2403 family nucleotidyltransferase fold protein, partial [Labilithrix sp.]|nr:GSU2403 family nucleotidyltransferase fold protein [Labilithrix sp.]
MKALPVTTQTAYAELLDQLLALDAHRSIGHAPGTFVTKTIKGRSYTYFQYSTPGGTTRQAYIGPASAALDAVVARFAAEREALREDRERIDELAAVLRAGGAAVTDAASARVLAALADAGVFKLGGVLVGTHAFLALGNLLGVRWDGASARTEDVDIGVARVLEVAVPPADADVPRAIERLEMGFLPVPGFSPKDASTSFKVRGRGLRVDLVTPGDRARTGKPLHVGRFNAAAAPVRYLELALEDTQPAAVVNGGGVLVSVPHPARFALLKLLVAQDRPSAFQT